MATTKNTKPLSQEQRASRVLDGLTAIEAQLCRLGGGEQRQYYAHMHDLKVLQSPEPVLARAERDLASWAAVIEQCVARARSREVEASAYAAEQKAIAEKHRAEVAERIERAEEHRMQQLAQLRAGG